MTQNERTGAQAPVLPDEWLRAIKKVAKKAAYDWPGVSSADDIFQGVCLHILESPGTQRDLHDMNQIDRYRSLHKYAQRIASQERHGYARFVGNFRYSVDEVRVMLESWATLGVVQGLGSSWRTGDQTSSGGGHSDPTASEAFRRIEADARTEDLGLGLAALAESNEGQHQMIIRRYIHEESGMGDADRKRLQRALESLTTEMNKPHKRDPVGELVPGKSLGDGPGTRRVISNSTARYMSKEAWDADYIPAPAHLRDNAIEAEVWE